MNNGTSHATLTAAVEHFQGYEDILTFISGSSALKSNSFGCTDGRQIKEKPDINSFSKNTSA